MKPCSSLKSIWGSIYTCSCGLVKLGASWGNLAEIPQIMGRDTKKFIESVKFQISHQMKSYWSVKTICRSSYTCFSIFAELGPKYHKSWAPIHRKSFVVLNSTIHIKWSCTHLKSIWGSIYTCSCAFAKLGQVREIWHKYPKSSKVLNSTLHIKWSLTQG